MAEYKALRAGLAAAVPTALAPDSSTAARLAAANLHFAVVELRPSLGATGNAAVAPALTHAALNGLTAAATGATLTEITNHFDTPTPWAAAAQTGLVTRQLWGDRGRRLRTDFLVATDALGTSPPLASWSADEVGFTDGTAASDAGLTTALTAAGVSLGAFASPNDIRLLSLDRLAVDAGWDEVVPFDGVFERGTRDLLRLPMLRLTAGVTRHAGADYTADVLRAGDLRVMSLRPTSGSLKDFADARLEPALAEAIEALLGDSTATAPPAAGEMVLPVADLALSIPADAPLRRVGVSLVYDDVNADLHGLDGFGGTYVQARSADARLALASGGLSLRAAHAMAYTFDPRNVNYSAGFNGSSFGSGDITFQADANQSFAVCVWPTAHLRSFFLIVLDSRHWVISLVAIQNPGGAAVLPTCS